MPDERSLKEKLEEAVEDIEEIVSEITELLNEGKEEGSDSQETVTSLMERFDKQCLIYTELVNNVPEHQKRQVEIRELEERVNKRNEFITKIADELKATKDKLEEYIFQAQGKLRSIRESETNRVFSEEVIRLACQISKSHSVAAPNDWQQGDSARPFPTMADFAVSHLVRGHQPAGTNSSNSVGNNPASVASVSGVASTSRGLNLTQQGTMMNQVMMLRQQQQAGVQSPSAVLSKAGSNSALSRSSPMAQFGQQSQQKGQAFTPSPRGGRGGGVTSSPRGRPPGSGSSALTSPNISGASMPSPSTMGRPIHPTILQQQGRMPTQQSPHVASSNIIGQMEDVSIDDLQVTPMNVNMNLAGNAGVVEQMTSDSSSSSSSGDEASPGN